MAPRRTTATATAAAAVEVVDGAGDDAALTKVARRLSHHTIRRRDFKRANGPKALYEHRKSQAQSTRLARAWKQQTKELEAAAGSRAGSGLNTTHLAGVYRLSRGARKLMRSVVTNKLLRDVSEARNIMDATDRTTLTAKIFAHAAQVELRTTAVCVKDAPAVTLTLAPTVA